MLRCASLARTFAVSLTLVSFARAQLTEFTDPGSYTAAVGAHQTIHFTEVAAGTLLSTEYQAMGLVFTDGNDLVTFNGAFVNDNVGIDAQGRIDITFSSPQAHIGVDFPGALRIELFNGNTPVAASSDFAGSGAGFFGGVLSNQTFTRVVLLDWVDDFVYIDDLHFGAGAPTSNYCTAGTTSHGCLPTMQGIGTPSASAASGFVLKADQVEGQRAGLIFYGASGQVAVPWALGSSSFLCVKPPTQRTLVQQSGGTVNQCDGALQVDWNAFMAANPGALGNPRSAGQTFDAQAWFRDPPAVKTTNLTDGLHFTLQP